MQVRHWLRPPRQLLVVFFAVAIVSVAALGWLGWLLLQQDDALDVQRRQEALEQAADRAAAAMQRSISDLQAAATSGEARPPAGVVALSIEPGRLTALPAGSLLFYPIRTYRPAAPVSPAFDEAERLEFATNGLKAAEAAYARLIDSRDLDVRAVALSRLARVRRKLRDMAGALNAYRALDSLDLAFVGDLPAGLVARVGRASVFEETGRRDDLSREAHALGRELASGRWPLLASEYEFYTSQTGAWLGEKLREDQDARLHSEAAGWLWENRDSLSSYQRRIVSLPSGAALVAGQRDIDGVNGIVAGGAYLASLCAQTAPNLRCTLTDAEGRPLIGTPPASRTTAVRPAATTGLPWTLHLSALSDAGDLPSPRRRLLLSVFAVVGFVLVVGWYFIGRAMARERRVSRLQSDFVAAVSHEFRSPLTSLSHIADMLAADRVRNTEDKRRSYDLLVRETDRLRRLVEDLLEFGRFEAGVTVRRFEPLDIAALVRQTVSEFNDRATRDGYRIELSASDGAIYAQADREALCRALWNLMDNAVKYSPACRTVWVSVAQDDANHVSIAVRDQGLGIPVHEQRDIFERFVRGADSKARHIKGTGIGLAMVREIARAHGGDVQVMSEPGRGSRFTLVLKTTGVTI